MCSWPSTRTSCLMRHPADTSSCLMPFPWAKPPPELLPALCWCFRRQHGTAYAALCLLIHTNPLIFLWNIKHNHDIENEGVADLKVGSAYLKIALKQTLSFCTEGLAGIYSAVESSDSSIGIGKNANQEGPGIIGLFWFIPRSTPP